MSLVRVRWNWKVTLPALVALAACLAYGQGNGKLQIHFMDVGQGDGAVLVSPEGETVLFDNGPSSECDKTVAYVLRLGVRKIDYHIASHYHADHIGCTQQILQQLPLEHDALDRGGSNNTTVYGRYVAAVGTHRQTAAKGMTILLDAASAQPVEIRIAALNGNGIHTTDENLLSISAVVQYGSFRAEIGGDLGENVETSVAPEVGHIEVYKVHHHGSSTGSGVAWLAATTPKVGIISVGTGNSYHHPTQDCLDRLHAAGVKTYWTEVGNGAAPVPGWDVVAGDVLVEAEPASDLFTVTYGTTTDHYTNWETTLQTVNSASLLPGLSPSTWITLSGTNFTTASRAWREEEIVDGRLPTQLEGVSVTINSNPAAVNYVSPSRIIVQVPDDQTVGPVQVQVTTAQQTWSGTAQMQRFSPGLFTLDGRYATALHADYSLVGRVNLLAGVTTTPAEPGGTVDLWGTGFGWTTPAIPSGELVTQPALTANPVTASIGGVQAQVQWARLSAAGVWQIRIRIPDNLPNGDARVVAEVGGVHTQDNVFLTIGR